MIWSSLPLHGMVIKTIGNACPLAVVVGDCSVTMDFRHELDRGSRDLHIHFSFARFWCNSGSGVRRGSSQVAANYVETLLRDGREEDFRVQKVVVWSLDGR